RARVIHLVVLFFLQEEAGIRYLTVTGVQTCALPISPSPWARGRGPVRPAGLRPRPAGRTGPRPRAHGLGEDLGPGHRPGRPALRSEERRVGKRGEVVCAGGGRLGYRCVCVWL